MCINYVLKQPRSLFRLLTIITHMGLSQNLPISSKVKSLHADCIRTAAHTFPREANSIYWPHSYGAGEMP